jgi:hypothetical protein
MLGCGSQQGDAVGWVQLAEPNGLIALQRHQRDSPAQPPAEHFEIVSERRPHLDLLARVSASARNQDSIPIKPGQRRCIGLLVRAESHLSGTSHLGRILHTDPAEAMTDYDTTILNDTNHVHAGGLRTTTALGFRLS